MKHLKKIEYIKFLILALIIYLNSILILKKILLN
jgi:hypothetical protein